MAKYITTKLFNKIVMNNNIEIITDKLTKLNITENIDISGKNPYNLYNKLSYKKWIKLINNKCILFNNYNRKEYFIKTAKIILDNDTHINNKNQKIKKRNTLIKFIPTIPKENFNKKREWLYLFTINNKIIKLGGTRNGIKGRINSYLCGHHIKERNKSGDCSKTNGYVYNTLLFYLMLNCEIEMYGYELPKNDLTIPILNNNVKITPQTYHAYESTFLNDYKKIYGTYPPMCDNCDPKYRK